MKTCIRLAVFSMLAATVFPGNTTWADVTSGDSAGTALTLEVSSAVSLNYTSSTVSATTSVLSTPLPTSSGSAPSAYSQSSGPSAYAQVGSGTSVSIPPFSSASASTLNFSAGALRNLATSDVDDLPGMRVTTGSSSLQNLNLRFGTVSGAGMPGSLDTIRISASTVSASATVTGAGTGTPFVASYLRSVVDFNIEIFGVSILSSFGGDLAANLANGVAVDVTLNLGSLSITVPGLSSLNLSGFIRVSNAGLTTSNNEEGEASVAALRVDFQDIAVSASMGGVVNYASAMDGEVSVGEARAAQAVPEPATAILILAGTAAMLLRRRRD